ncbi:hypothetical protein, conserved [Trypanosoma brucei gambiense DAL972]|uniref:ODAD1 central coiled coil region domain-containing protein n=1 Tax=Trypanosoma brucei gambiense (strain MHOM/CI/86/DAL972) TaxID=679716 RepID=C9ZTM9_TRYB9|nr:hypothetical protein, conserved [Trypanosoma brucei gambiense DAL972]CBH12764.1 hypothetical protein, conserved [Trypanosoma brucei gambiense DAL972]|eukprot:XP_011775044.1 hypothetical protein, conserved [Trypanosoma brucei gambiense DAL972]
MQAKGDGSGSFTQRSPRIINGEGNENVADTLRRRYVQAELQLRECEDRFRRDCARQEQELELIQFENNKLKVRIEEMRMAENAVDKESSSRSPGGACVAAEHDSKLLKASSQKYRSAREAVERARNELVDLEAQLSAARVRFNELRCRHGSTSSAANASSLQTYRNRREEEEQIEASRARLRGLESHVETESDRLSTLIEEGKAMRLEIDLQITMQNQVDALRQDREGEMVEIMKETSFLIEVCNLLVEERSECEHQLAELRKAAEADAEAYEKAFYELVAVEDRNKIQAQNVREGIDKLTDELAEVVKERTAAEHDLVNKHNETGAAAQDDTDEDGDGLESQLKEFEVYLNRLGKIVGTCDLAEVESYVCDENGERFQLYNVIQSKQSAARELEEERNELMKKLNILVDGTEKQRQEREEVKRLQSHLKDLQEETEAIEKRSEKTRAVLAESVLHLQKTYTSIGCVAPKLVLTKEGSTPSLHSVHELFAAIERRTEDYLAVWSHDRNGNQAKLMGGRTGPFTAHLLDPMPKFIKEETDTSKPAGLTKPRHEQIGIELDEGYGSGLSSPATARGE